MTSLWEVDENILNKGVQGKLRRGREAIKNPAVAGLVGVALFLDRDLV
jgi:hypothetical protein